MITSYVVRGPWNESFGDFEYWNSDLGWDTLGNSTHYGFEVFYRPLPMGATGVVEFHGDNLHTSYLIVPVEYPTLGEAPFVWN